MDHARARQVAFNASSQDHWDAFAAHRRIVSGLLGAGRTGRAGRLCVLGVGNGFDLDLPALLEAHREVHVVDLDAEALRRGLALQGVEGHPRLRTFGGVDVTGMLDVVAGWSPGAAMGPGELAAMAEAPGRMVPPALAGPYDRLASTCLLRPLIGSVYHALGERHPAFDSLVRAVRAGHLRLLSRLLAAGGEAVLITDVVSSETVPGLGSLPESSLPALLRRVDRDGNHFHGVGPTDLVRAARLDPLLQGRGVVTQTDRPWRWNLHGRVYLVWAIRLRAPSPGSP